MANASNIELESQFQESIANILRLMGLSATIIVDTVEADGRHYFKVDLEGEEIGVLIGYHGRTLDALRTVLAMMAPKVNDEIYGVLLDVNQYHAKREDYIRKMSLSAIEQVKMTAQAMELMPMKPAERRIVHMVVQEYPELATESVGDEPERRVVIKPKS